MNNDMLNILRGIANPAGGYKFSDRWAASEALKTLSSARDGAIDECIKAIESERLVDPTDSADDIAYGNAINDCVRAVERLKNA
jgi:hypothetical protein